MDILAARKKAAERAQAKKAAEAAQPVESSFVPVDTAPPAVEAGALLSGPAPKPAAPAVALPGAPPAQAGAEKAVAPAGDDSNTQKQTEEIELLSFNLSGEEYAVMVENVREVLKTRDLTRVPNAPDYILGVTSLRGTMLPIMDLCSRLGLTQAERTDKARIIVVSPDEEDVGFVVDRVHSVIRVRPDAIKPAPEHVEHGAEFLRGIVRLGDKLYIVLDLRKAVMK
ncbi:MAG: chemotaxis protein CheW [Nitrospiraceae bacterium]|nr:chemotaxis protein CheW [Nitrospiraceae bacterium]